MKFQGEFDGSDKRKYPKKKQTRRSKSGDTLIDDAVTSFPTEEEMSLRIAEPSIEEATPNVVESSIEEVCPSAGETPVEVASQSVVENAESAEVTPDVQESAFHDIPREQLKGVLEVFKSKGGWQRTPPPIIEALKTSGFTVRITKRGTAEKRGDTLQLSRPNDTEVHIYSTDEAAELLRKIIGEQRIREKHRKREKKELSQASVVR
ncbi:hypothetical protein IPH92_04985 [Candidatus Kaiserbacteria bacterium]|nr:MAG: hypothetical protein IPH92_04985 [Candidatus Kaiserbacteria bacterium]